MAEDLKDLRCKIAPLTACYLEAEARATNTDKCVIVRQLLDEWASRRHEMSITAQRLLAAEGVGGESQGSSGNRRESQGGRGLKWDD